MDETLLEFTLFGQGVVITPWKIFGMIGVALFTGRWLFQMYYSRKAGRPVTPRIFWLMSVAGSLILLSYFIFSPKRDMVGIMSNLFPSIIALYNLYLDLTHEKKVMAQEAAKAATPPPRPEVRVETSISSRIAAASD
ncbi:MAG TPA: lipid-A-disaccharide synthase N-terminal domain-containing protein [Planctomycetota bacterium]|nr:lipid-A-disaccharide synthase N-terminal domain-containing protein [Planctomycetota bacterium]